MVQLTLVEVRQSFDLLPLKDCSQVEIIDYIIDLPVNCSKGRIPSPIAYLEIDHNRTFK
jgi:hypothetical protein